jgi:hypothetical protein
VKTKIELKITAKELELLKEIKLEQNEPGHSDFTQENVETRSRAGILGSLVQKGFVYNSYANLEDEDANLWCLTYEGVDVVGVPETWLDDEVQQYENYKKNKNLD